MTDPLFRLDAASEILTEASRLALDFFDRRQTIETRSKTVQDFVSEADTAVERLIRQRLEGVFPGERVLGEEMGGEAADAYWIVDPIDGTSNFLRGSPLWSISLGFVSEGEPVYGLVALPLAGEIYAAGPGTGLRLNGKPLARQVPFGDIRIVSLGDSPGEDLDLWSGLLLGLRRANWTVEGFHSSAISLVYAACGHFDGHLQPVASMWDLAGGAVLAREAGLTVRMGEASLAGRHWIAAGTPALLATAERLWPDIAEPTAFPATA